MCLRRFSAIPTSSTWSTPTTPGFANGPESAGDTWSTTRESTVDLAERAARAALDAAGTRPKRETRSHRRRERPRRTGSIPATACRLQARLGAGGLPGLRRAGGVHRLHLRSRSSGPIHAHRFGPPCALVIGADTHSRLLDWSDRTYLHSLRGRRGRGRAGRRRACRESCSTHLARGRELRRPPLCGRRSAEEATESSPKAALTPRCAATKSSRLRCVPFTASSTRRWRRMRSPEVRHRLADSAPGQHPHHRSHRTQARAADGKGGRHHRRARKHVRRLGAPGIRRRGARRPDKAGRQPVAGGVRRRLHLGLGPDPLLRRLDTDTGSETRGTGMGFAFMFPGQGSQSLRMMDEPCAALHPQVRTTFDAASDHARLRSLRGNWCRKAPASASTKPGTDAARHAGRRCRDLARVGRRPEDETPDLIVAGHSLGEYSALVCAEKRRLCRAHVRRGVGARAPDAVRRAAWVKAPSPRCWASKTPAVEDLCVGGECRLAEASRSMGGELQRARTGGGRR